MSALSVTASGAAARAIEAAVPGLVAERFASRLFEQDATLWGEAAVDEASERLAWVGLARSSRPLVGEISALREELRDRGVDRIVLCGMGGSSLAPEVICATAGVPLVVLDSSHPDVVRRVAADVSTTAVVVSSKSGSTVETDSQRRVLEQAFVDAGIDPAERVVVVTDPGSPLEEESRGKGYRVITADPSVGGRYSALTAFGLVPSGLAGADIEELLDDAESMTDLLAEDDEANPGLRLGAAMAATDPLRDKLYLVDHGTELRGLGDWAEQLIAESTGKDGTGILPVVLARPGSTPPPDDATVVRLLSADDEDTEPGDAASVVDVAGTLGGQLLLWEVATAVAGRVLGINPFDQPDVESAKAAARGLLEGGMSERPAAEATDGAVEIRQAGGSWLGAADTLAAALDALVGQLPDAGYVAVMAYLDREEESGLPAAADALAERLGRPVTFGWGPRFLHSTGQYHKGGPANGVYVQITEEPQEDLAIPGREFTLGEFIAAQAGGDAQVLADKGRPVLQLHLTDHAAGLAQVTEALGSGR